MSQRIAVKSEIGIAEFGTLQVCSCRHFLADIRRTALKFREPVAFKNYIVTVFILFRLDTAGSAERVAYSRTGAEIVNAAQTDYALICRGACQTFTFSFETDSERIALFDIAEKESRAVAVVDAGIIDIAGA